MPPGGDATSSELFARIDAARDDLVALTQDLIRIPTLNPPGEAYLEICEYLSNRLKPRGFGVEMIRAKDTPGDSDKYPRWNVIARRDVCSGDTYDLAVAQNRLTRGNRTYRDFMATRDRCIQGDRAL